MSYDDQIASLGHASPGYGRTEPNALKQKPVSMLANEELTHIRAEIDQLLSNINEITSRIRQIMERLS